MRKKNRFTGEWGFQLVSFCVLLGIIIISFIWSDLSKKRICSLSVSDMQSFLVAGFCLFTVGVIFHERKQMKLLRESRKLEVELRYSGVISALSKEYDTLFLVNPEKGTAETLRSCDDKIHEDPLKLLSETHDYSSLISMYTDRFVHDEDKERVINESSIDNILKNIRENDICIIDYRRCSDEDILYYQMSFAAADNSGENILVCGFRNTDESVRKQKKQEKQLKEALEQANSANKAKTEFLSVMSHDIRTPLNGIIGMASVAEKNINDSKRVQDCLEKISLSGEYLLSLVNEILDMSRIESGKDELVCDTFDIVELVKKTVSVYEPEAEKHSHKFICEIKTAEHNTVYGDSVKIQQIYSNLLSNAVKYTPDGGKIKIIFSEKSYDLSKGRCYEFTVEDNGIGISEEYLSRIFEMFSREKDSRVSKIQGTGLGLSIAQKFAGLMNGNISVKSEAGKGSSFTAVLFLKPSEIKKKTDNTSVSLIPDLSGRHLLVAEDNIINAEIAREILLQTNAAVDIAENGKDAVELYSLHEAGYYSMIFLDIQMPLMNGYDAVKAIRNSEKSDSRSVPVIAMTADAFKEDMDKVYESGMNGHISKPLKPLNIWIEIEKNLI